MPTYEYQCKACGHQFEEFQKITDAPITVCPKCQEAAATKLVSAAAFQLKGTGWYVTDFRNKGKASTESAPDQSKSEPATDKVKEKADSKTKEQTKSESKGGATKSSSE